MAYKALIANIEQTHVAKIYGKLGRGGVGWPPRIFGK